MINKLVLLCVLVVTLDVKIYSAAYSFKTLISLTYSTSNFASLPGPSLESQKAA